VNKGVIRSSVDRDVAHSADEAVRPGAAFRASGCDHGATVLVDPCRATARSARQSFCSSRLYGAVADQAGTDREVIGSLPDVVVAPRA